MMFQDVLLPRGTFYVCVDFGGEDALMAEHFLYNPQVRAPFYEMCREGMPECVGLYLLGYSCGKGLFLDHVED